MGKTVVQGGLSRRFSPKRPEVNIYSNVEDEIKNSQSSFFAVDLVHQEKLEMEKGESNFLLKCTLRDAIEDRTLTEIADTYDAQGGRLNSGFWDDKAGGFFLTANDGEKLILRSKEIYDGALPSGNSVFAMSCVPSVWSQP